VHNSGSARVLSDLLHYSEWRQVLPQLADGWSDLSGVGHWRLSAGIRPHQTRYRVQFLWPSRYLATVRHIGRRWGSRSHREGPGVRILATPSNSCRSDGFFRFSDSLCGGPDPRPGIGAGFPALDPVHRLRGRRLGTCCTTADAPYRSRRQTRVPTGVSTGAMKRPQARP
jgi:hypothetical protein